ncbi:hypothetical protein JCM8097_002966 [Rhodosporidiobolus ruineniae]
MASWDLSPLYRHQQSLVLPDAHRIASFHNGRVILRHLDSLTILRTWALSSPSPTSSSTFAPPSSARSALTSPPLQDLTSLTASPHEPYYLLAFSAKARTAWVLNPEEDSIYARLDVGNEGAVRMEWALTGREGEAAVMAWSANHLRLSIFRLSTPSSPALHILSPKHSHASGHAFHPAGMHLAVLERHDSRDVVGIYSTQGDWSLIRTFILPDPASDLAGLSWSPCGRYLALWSHITDYLIHFYLPTGHHLSTFAPYASLAAPAPSTSPSSSTTSISAATAKRAASRQPPQPSSREKEKDREDKPAQSAADRARMERSTSSYVGLGVRCVEWSAEGEWVAIGGYDGRIRLLSPLASFAPLAELSLPASNRIAEPGVRVWKEPAGWIEKTRGRGIVSYDPQPLPYSLLPSPPAPSVPNPKMGLARLVFAPSSRWIAAKNETYPNVLAVFAFPLGGVSGGGGAGDAGGKAGRPRLHTVLVLDAPVRDFAFRPASDSTAHGNGAEGGGEREMLVAVSGEKAFSVWRAPVLGEEGGVGEAEGVGVPAGNSPLSLTALSFSHPPPLSPHPPALLLSSSPALPQPNTSSQPRAKPLSSVEGGGGAGTEDGGLFCVAYPVEEGEDGGEEAGRTWMEGDSEAPH